MVDINDLVRFYDSPIGGRVKRSLGTKIHSLWPSAANENILGVGYTFPFIKDFHPESEHLCCLMPQKLGARVWPVNGKSLVTLADERHFPFSDRLFDKVLLIHSLEFIDDPSALLQECWRTLTHRGKLLACVPNRTGLWSHMDKTPLGSGQPYTLGQLTKALKNNHFDILRILHALHFLPLKSHRMLHLLHPLEAFSQKWMPHLGGMVIVEASKTLWSPPVEKASLQAKPIAPFQGYI